MKEQKQTLINDVREAFILNDFYFVEYANGYFKVFDVDYWATTEIWIDKDGGTRGKGIYTFIKYINEVFK